MTFTKLFPTNHDWGWGGGCGWRRRWGGCGGGCGWRRRWWW
ncbi:hypothetical protein FHS43_001862 [Streptosporangium becharense]|uniref:Uncharacterized protein n=1 Tax=Streptosporangium becharense TaxID=1816182 RepID=A0A7W9IAR9_9ACTN|nr:hypothetical protein [Streptosporangium becharense]MBB2910599.1 hypothetical protein [Streptosporangium becharense]MBB5817297.1 hypothetical protein [Streptosporangium becharense]